MEVSLQMKLETQIFLSQYRFTYDGTSPSVTVSSQDVSSGQKTNDSSINLTFTLSEASTDFLLMIFPSLVDPYLVLMVQDQFTLQY